MSNSPDIHSLKAEQAEFANDLGIGCETKKRTKDECGAFSVSHWKNKTVC